MSEPVDIVTVTGRRPGGGIGYRPIFWGGGGGGGPPVPPPAPPPSTDGVDTVVVTGQRPGRFDTEAQARDFGIALTQAQPDRNRREYGLFVVKIGDKYDVSELIAGPIGRDSLGTFSADGANGTNKVPPNAVGFMHSHPAGMFDGADRTGNMYLSRNDMESWRFFKQATGNNNFKMWLIGPDENVREFDQETDVPPTAWRTPEGREREVDPPDRRTVPHVGPDFRWRGEPGPNPVQVNPPAPVPSPPPSPDGPVGSGSGW